MVECDVPLKRKHRFSDYPYRNLVASVPIVTALIAIFTMSVLWIIIYVIIGIITIGMIYRYYCTHCPHYIESDGATKCMFFRGLPKFFVERPGPLSLFDKAVSFTAPRRSRPLSALLAPRTKRVTGNLCSISRGVICNDSTL
jgi:hypothetical protein